MEILQVVVLEKQAVHGTPLALTDKLFHPSII